MKNKLLQILEKKWKNKTLGHFYILQGGEKETSSFINDFLKMIPASSNHPDVLFIKKEEEKKAYSWESDFAELFTFIKYAPLNLVKKVIILPDAHLLTPDVSNKILRTLEDLEEGVFFFLCPQQRSLLPTIESRAITLRIPEEKKETKDRLYPTSQLGEWFTQFNLPIDLFKNYQGIGSFLESLKEDSEGQENILNLLLDWESNHLSNYKQKESFLEEIKRFQTSLTYNNVFKERFVSLLSSCQVS